MSLFNKEIKAFSDTYIPPFKIFSRPDGIPGEEPSKYIVTVAPGTINNLIPINLIGQNNTLNEFDIQPNSINYVKLFCNSNGQSINLVDIKIENQTIRPQQPVGFGMPDKFEILVGVVLNTQVLQVLDRSLTLGAKVQYVLKADKPGGLPFVPYDMGIKYDYLHN